MKKSIFWLLAISILSAAVYFSENRVLAEPFITKNKKLQKEFSELKTGDIVFQVNESGQGKAIQLATHSIYTHCGIVFMDHGKTMVYEAVQPVRITPMEEWIKQGEDKAYVAKRLKDDILLTTEKTDAMRNYATSLLGKNYDIFFNWSDDDIYCSELVWKIYHQALGVDLCEPRPLRDFDLSHPEVRRIMEQRYGETIPLKEVMVSPGDLFDSKMLVEVQKPS